MRKTNTGGNAFPVTEQNGANFGDCGMTLRDYFAAKAMQGIVAGNSTWNDLGFFPKDGFSITENYAICAYELADAMLKVRES